MFNKIRTSSELRNGSTIVTVHHIIFRQSYIYLKSENTAMTSPSASAGKDVTNWNWQKWLEDTFKETDDKIIEDANKSVDEELRLAVNNNSGLDNEVVNLSRDSITENEVTSVVSQSPEKEPATEQLLEVNDTVLKQTHGTEQTATLQAELPVYITRLLEKNGPSNSESKDIADVCRDSNKEARRKALPKINEVCQPQGELPSFIEGLLENSACSSGKRKAECDGNSKSKKWGNKTTVDSKLTKPQIQNKDVDLKIKRRRERERKRAKENRAKKKQLDAANETKRLSLDKEVDDLRNQIEEKEEMTKRLELQITEKDSVIVNLERLQREKDLENVYLQKKIRRLEHEKEEKDAEIVFLKNKLEFRI